MKSNILISITLEEFETLSYILTEAISRIEFIGLSNAKHKFAYQLQEKFSYKKYLELKEKSKSR